MEFTVIDAFRARAQRCSIRAGLTKDAVLKKYWDDLADDWMALDAIDHPFKDVA